MDLCGQNTDRCPGSGEGGKARKTGAPPPVMALNAEPGENRRNVARSFYVRWVRAG